ncbi:AMP-binding protein [Actinospica durhamensis]|uniref:AMP-binding protein n=1 Tax=Actinospica durhamensis TaxID=1508375 RepID=A0A941IRJ1_9ACTN|nr:AMP-binding protein [Actinospica durhamensis]MBR7835362.1 AMP-binding protein [Actinospica durhamensis]
MGRTEVLHELVARSADRSRQAAAVRQGELELTYGELQALAVQFAAELACAGVGEGQVVALDLPGNVRMIAAMLATGILGGAFLPLDQRDPVARQAALGADFAAAALVTEDAVHATGAAARLDGRPAYVTYTAGSAERPRAVVTGQRVAVDHVEAALHEYRLRPGDRQLQFTPPGSGLAVEEVFTTLASGATLVLRDADFGYEDVADFLRLADERALTVLTLPTGLCEEFGGELARRPKLLLPRGLRLLVAGGEPASAQACAAWQAAARDAGFRIVNSTGPSDCAAERPLSLLR